LLASADGSQTRDEIMTLIAKNTTAILTMSAIRLSEITLCVSMIMIATTASN
jgi:hypothetical protein